MQKLPKPTCIAVWAPHNLRKAIAADAQKQRSRSVSATVRNALMTFYGLHPVAKSVRARVRPSTAAA